MSRRIAEDTLQPAGSNLASKCVPFCDHVFRAGDCGKYESECACGVCPQEGHPIADALYGPGGYEHTVLRIDSQELSIRISEETARSELEAMERRPDRELVAPLQTSRPAEGNLREHIPSTVGHAISCR